MVVRLALVLVVVLGDAAGAAALEGPYLGEAPPGDRRQRFAPQVIACPPEGR